MDTSLVTEHNARKATTAVLLYAAAGAATGAAVKWLGEAGSLDAVGQGANSLIGIFAIWATIHAFIARMSSKVLLGALNTFGFFAGLVGGHVGYAAWQYDVDGAFWKMWAILACTVVPILGGALTWACLKNHAGWGWGNLDGPVLAIPMGIVAGEMMFLARAEPVPDAGALILFDGVLLLLLIAFVPRNMPGRIVAVFVAMPLAFVFAYWFDNQYVDWFMDLYTQITTGN